MNIELSAQIAAPASRVFSVLDDDASVQRWMVGLEETVYLSRPEPPEVVGTRFRQRVREFGRAVEYLGKVIRYEPPRYLAIRLEHPRATVEVQYELEQTDDHLSRLVYRTQMIESDPTAARLASLMAWYTKKVANTQLQSIKKIAEKSD
ncbi:MAG: SRPBCC family protein [Pseudomonadota bacterium]|nr:SRPBCC family protein [Pseudomonadota bacterium]